VTTSFIFFVGFHVDSLSVGDAVPDLVSPVNGAWAMPFTFLIVPKLFKEKAMTYEEQAQAWIRSSPFVQIPIGRFTLKIKFKADQDWGWD
jgi:hypothetical protein